MQYRSMLIALSLVLPVLSYDANASFISTDWKVAGDAKAVLDVSTGLEWLKIDNTKGLSPSQVGQSVQNENHVLYGWRFATEQEYRQMISNFFGRNAIDTVLTTSERAAFHNTFGLSNTNEASAWLAAGDANGRVVQTGTRNNNTSLNFYLYQNNNYYTTPVSWLGVWVVSDGGTTLSSINDPALNINNPNAPVNQGGVTPPADVSGVAGFGLLGLLLTGLGLRRRSRQ